MNDFMATHRNNSISHEVKALYHILTRKIIASVDKAGVDKVTFMHGWIMCYLDDNSDRDIYQKDLETEFGISRSTVTNILKMMEKKGYIERMSVENDARLKKLILTERGKMTNSILKSTFIENEACVNSLLPEEERNTFLKLARKLRKGLESN